MARKEVRKIGRRERWSSSYLFRQVCTDALDRAAAMVGTEYYPIKIDESYFSGRRKNRRGGKLAWDRASDAANAARALQDEEDVHVSQWPQARAAATRQAKVGTGDWGADVPEPNHEESNPTPNRNFGNRELGP